MAKHLIIEQVIRTRAGQPDERLAFGPGVNVVVGPPNTGKTGWLRMINYVLSSDEKTEEAIGAELADKYDGVTLSVRIGDAQHRIARRWKEAGNKTKVFVDDNGMSADDLSHFLMEQLGIPMLHYPQGNPMGPRTWPELTWRSLYRHIYRRQRFWADLADQQPESEQHACILQFAGLAQYLFSDEFGNLVKSQKRIMDLQTRKEQFVEMLQEVSKDIVDEPGMAVALTPESLNGAIVQLENKTTEIAARRDDLLRSVAATAAGNIPDHPPVYEKMTDDLARFKSAEAASTQRFRKAEDRLAELQRYQQTVQNELARLQRAQSAGRLLADLKVTHCPACDQEIKRKDEHTNVCYVCGQNNAIDNGTTENAAKRLAFEVEQLEAESKESGQLVAALEKERAQTLSERSRTRQRIQELESELRPIQTAAAQIMPAELSIYDMEAGRLQERIKQLRRIEIALSKREIINQQIETIQAEVAALESQVATQAKNLDFDQASDELTDGINNYLNAIKAGNPRSWTISAQIRFELRERGFRVKVGNESWKSKLGGTLTLYFVIAYQYALLQLSKNAARNFPGLLLLDFPAQLEDGTSVADKENFVLEPFLQLCKELGTDYGQVIAMGSAFQNLEVASRTELTTIWQ
jgi:hypothetical protein